MRIGIQRITFDYGGQEAWIDTRKPTAGELFAIDKGFKAEDPESAFNACCSLLDSVLVDWNFEDEQRTHRKWWQFWRWFRKATLPVNSKTIRALPGDLLIAIVKKTNEVAIEIPLAQRKPSTAQSSSETENRP